MSSPAHGETASAVHAQEAQTSFRSWSRTQRAASALQNACVLWPGPVDLARDQGWLGRGVADNPPRDEFVGPNISQVVAAAVRNGKWEFVESWLVGFVFQQHEGQQRRSWSLWCVGRCLFASHHIGGSELCSSPLPVGADGQLSRGATRQQGGCQCRAAWDPSTEDDRLASQHQASGISLTSNSTGCAWGEIWVGFFYITYLWREFQPLWDSSVLLYLSLGSLFFVPSSGFFNLLYFTSALSWSKCLSWSSVAPGLPNIGCMAKSLMVLQWSHGAPKSRQLIPKCADEVQRREKYEERAQEPDLPNGKRLSAAKQ